MGTQDDSLKRLGASIDKVMRHIKAPSPDVLSAVFGRWPEIVGEDMAAHARPSYIDGQTLVVNADDPTWASQIRWLESQMLEQIEKVSGSARIRAIKVRVERQGSGP